VAVKVRRETGDLGLAAAFDFAGIPAVQDQALGCMGAAGRLALVGITGKPLTISDGRTSGYQQQQVRGHYGSARDVLPLSEAPRPSSGCGARKETRSGWCCDRNRPPSS